MKIDYTELQVVFDELKKLTSDYKQSAYAMLKLTETKDLEVCFADNNLSFNKKIEGTAEDGDEEKNIIVDIKLFTSRLELFRASGSIQLTPLSLKIEGDSLRLKATKYLQIARFDEDGELEMDAEGNCVTDKLDGMEVDTKLKYHDVSSNVKFSITTRTPYEELYVAHDGDKQVTVDKNWFVGTLEKLTKVSDAPVCAFSGQAGLSFAPGKSYVIKDSFDIPDMPAIGLSITIASKLLDILRKDDGEELTIIVSSDGKFTKVVNSEETLAVMVSNTKPSNTAFASLASYEQAKYDQARMQFNREMFVNLLSSTLRIIENGSAASKVQFKQSAMGDKLLMLISKKGSGSSEDVMHIIAENYDGDIKQLESTTLNIVLKVLDQAISTCNTPVLEVRLGETNGTKILRVAEIERNLVTKEMTEEHQVIYMCV